ncbi:predicted protein [Uncinocarpus reesii 1704]|uniref:AB hydrolase-1 domain-containing protein n=1 Tax=Uncinocarpus reesii (strain UAMH 1704) TaxID=336963 RepID=C4JDI4_UNCRE|nr:uncharacterized protein UREG_00710 [Uncinocarpus reesii 1704]EEP75863.1 predicted protein [Uncinocarpus reesii 1704]
MATIITAALLLLARSSASSIDFSRRTHGFCKQLDLPVFATADSAVYDLPRVNNDIETTAWAIHTDTWSTPLGPPTVIKNTTTSDTFSIHAQLCVPKSLAKKKDILQIATHGVHYDSRYWDPKLDPEKQSYVEAALREGYSILTYDRLGVGQSDHPDAYNVVQGPLEVEILRQLTLMARNGTLYDFAAKARPLHPAFKKLAKPSKVVHVGHSFGSVLTSAFIATYGLLTDGAIITGFVPNKYLAKGGYASFNAVKARDRPSGYIVCQKSGIQTIFFAGDLKTAFTKEMLDYGDAIKQPVPIGEFASAYHILGRKGPSFKAPIQYMLPEFDFYICGGDCKGIFNKQAIKETYPNATVIESAIQPNTGHAFTLHNNATAGYQVTFDFLARNGL